MSFSLSAEAASSGYRLAAYDTIGSTSTEAMARLRAGERGPLWVTSTHQSEGRGRRGSAWQTSHGNLAASLALTLNVEPATIATLGFVAGLALVRALDRCGSDGPASVEAFALKWPNDVLAGDAKLAGILLETEKAPLGRAVVVGIGVNVAHAPRGLPYPTTSLLQLGYAVSAEDVFEALSSEWVRLAALWDEGRGFGAIRDLWLLRAIGLGGAVSVRSGGSVVTGRFETVDRHGQLVVRASDGSSRAISAGEVHFGEAASARKEAAA